VLYLLLVGQGLPMPPCTEPPGRTDRGYEPVQFTAVQTRGETFWKKPACEDLGGKSLCAHRQPVSWRAKPWTRVLAALPTPGTRTSGVEPQNGASEAF
jgi:hypothetical protein